MSFKVGQKVVCVKGDIWRDKVTGQLEGNVAHPQLNETVNIVGFKAEDGFLLLKEYPGFAYRPSEFHPLIEHKGVTMTFEKLQSVQPIYQS